MDLGGGFVGKQISWGSVTHRAREVGKGLSHSLSSWSKADLPPINNSPLKAPTLVLLTEWSDPLAADALDLAHPLKRAELHGGGELCGEPHLAHGGVVGGGAGSGSHPAAVQSQTGGLAPGALPLRGHCRANEAGNKCLLKYINYILG